MILIPDLYDLLLIHLGQFQGALHVLHLHSMIVNELNFRLYGDFDVIATLCYMYMDRLMIIGEEEESQPENLEYRRHIILIVMASQR